MSRISSALFILNIATPIVGQTSLDEIERSCSLNKAYAVIIKLLAVYVSHVLTVKLEPGSRLKVAIGTYMAATCLPSTSARVACLDLFYWFQRERHDERDYQNMQAAIDAGAAFIRKNIGHYEIGTDETFILRGKHSDSQYIHRVPRGTSAKSFHRIKVESNKQLLKALIGLFQLTVATLQLMSSGDSRVAAYGYGSFVYTIIPYAIGTIVNVLASIIVGSYYDLVEMEFIEVEEPEKSTKGGTTSRHIQDDDPSELHLPTSRLIIAGIELAVYLAIVGGITRFKVGISSTAQRVWFVLWVVYGIVYGAISPMYSGLYVLRETSTIKSALVLSGFLILYGAPALGGYVAMIQQYLHLIQC